VKKIIALILSFLSYDSFLDYSVFIFWRGGSGVTVKEFISIFENVCGKKINKQEVEARFGDAAGANANVDKVNKLLNWVAEYSIEEGIRDALKWNEHRNKKMEFTY